MSRFIIVGAGGIGTWLANGLAPLLEYSVPNSTLIIVDGDHFEEKNKERQLFDGMGNKAEVLAEELNRKFNQTFIIPLAAWVVSPEVAESYKPEEEEEEDVGVGRVSASDLIEEGDVVYAVVDNYKARKELLDAASKMENCDVFLGGNDEKFYGGTYHYIRRNGEDVTQHPAVRHEEFVNPPDRNPGELSCQERAEIDGGTQLICTNMAVAAWLLGRTKYIIIDENTDDKCEIQFDLGMGMAIGDNRVPRKELVTTK